MARFTHLPRAAALALALGAVAPLAFSQDSIGVVIADPGVAVGVVAEPLHRAPSDNALMNAIVAAISSDPSLAGTRIVVIVDQGDVALSGDVPTRAQADRALAIAAGVGARRVVDDIRAAG